MFGYTLIKTSELDKINQYDELVSKCHLIKELQVETIRGSFNLGLFLNGKTIITSPLDFIENITKNLK